MGTAHNTATANPALPNHLVFADNRLEAFLPIAILFGLAAFVCVAIFGLSFFLGRRKFVAAKFTPYECGVKPEGTVRRPFKNRFYLIAVLFLLFDVEAAFFFPWALVYRDSLATAGGALLIAMGIYLVFMVLGLIYIFQKNALELR